MSRPVSWRGHKNKCVSGNRSKNFMFYAHMFFNCFFFLEKYNLKMHNSKFKNIYPPSPTGVIPISLFLLATGTLLRKAAIDQRVRLATGRYGCLQINKPSNSTVSVLI